MRIRNLDCEQPLSEMQVVKTAASAWRYEFRGENLKGRGGAMVISNAMFDSLFFDYPDVWRLFTLLRRHHWSRDFYLANELAKKLRWDRRRFYAARDAAVDLGLIERVRPASQHKPALYRWPSS